MEYRLAELAELLHAELRGDPERRIKGLRSLDAAGHEDLSFLTSSRYRSEAEASAAGALLVGPWGTELERDLLLVEDPYFTLSLALDLFFEVEQCKPGVHPTAIVEAGAKVDPAASVGPYVVIGPDTVVEAEVCIHSHVVIGKACRIRKSAILYPSAVLYDGCIVGERSILHAGVVLGSDGYGYALHDGRHEKLRHVGRVVVEEDVEIGANTTVDRALLEETRIGAGTKVDNLVQIAHNVEVGRGCLLVSQTGIAGSTKLGDGVIMAGQSGVSGHLTLGDGVQVAGKSAVFQSVDAGRKVAGIPAKAASTWRRQQALASRLGELHKRIRRIEKELSEGKEEQEVE